MQPNLSFLLLLLAGLLANVYASTDPEADKHCEETEGPGWEAKVDGDGNVLGCTKSEVSCFKNYKNPSTGAFECCPKDKPFKKAPGATGFGEGACCAPGEEVQVDQGKAGCCAQPKKWKWDTEANSGTCVTPPEPKTCITDDGTTCQNCGVCANKNICPCNGLGIQYGKCYTLQDTNGLQLAREIGGGGIYRSGGEINNLVFRVCKKTDDCSADHGKEVPLDGVWSMQDQLGTSYTPGMAWWGNGSPHMGATTTVTSAAAFTGETYCYNGQCGVCMRQSGKVPGLTAPCPMPGTDTLKVHIGATSNPQNCKAYFYQETPCLKGPPPDPVDPAKK